MNGSFTTPEPPKREGWDGDLLMFKREPAEPNQAHLRWLRWLVERDCLEHPACGEPCGIYALEVTKP